MAAIGAESRMHRSPRASLDWSRRLSQCTSRFKCSAVREILKAAVRPEVISFAGGLPAPDCFPSELIARAGARLLDGRHAGSTLQYGESEGLADLRQHLVTEAGVPSERVLITSGAQQGLDLLGRVLLDPGDTVVVENPTYLDALGAWRPHGVRFLPVAIDEEGMCVDDLERLLSAGERPKFLYTMPNFHNPAGAVLSRRRRERLIALTERHDLLILEDDPYGDLRYDGEALPSLLELAQAQGLGECVVRLGSFSKVVAPGLRVGWLTGASPLVDALVKVKQAADFHPNILGQKIVLEVIRDPAYPVHLEHLHRVYGARRDAMVEAVSAHFPEGTAWTMPEGGMFLMARLPRGRDAGACFQAALEAKRSPTCRSIISRSMNPGGMR